MMNFSFNSALEAVEKSKEYKDFRKKNKKAILFSAFFILTPDFEPDTRQIDFLLQDNKSIMTFFINPDGKINSKKDELSEKKKDALELKTEKLKELDFVIKEIKKILTDKPTKIIIILQHIEGKQVWNVTCILQSFKILSMHLDAFSGQLLSSKESNIFDFMQVKKNDKKE